MIWLLKTLNAGSSSSYNAGETFIIFRIAFFSSDDNCRSGATEKNREKLSACLERFEWAKNDLLLREGQVCKYIWFVDQGMIRLFYNKRGKDLTEHFAYEEGIFLSLERSCPARIS